MSPPPLLPYAGSWYQPVVWSPCADTLLATMAGKLVLSGAIDLLVVEVADAEVMAPALVELYVGQLTVSCLLLSDSVPRR